MTPIVPRISLASAAWIAGAGYILMFAAPVAESMVYHRLVHWEDPVGSYRNLSSHLFLLRTGILLYIVNILGDVLAAWGLYVLFRPAHAELSMLASGVRIIYSLLSLVAVMNLLTVLTLNSGASYLSGLSPAEVQGQTLLAVRAFRDGWSFAFVFFAIYLILLGFLQFLANYASRIVGICLLIAGVGWLIDSLQPFVAPACPSSIGMYAGVGELVFMGWLFFRGVRIKAGEVRAF